MLWTSIPLKSVFSGPETASSVIAKCTFGNWAASLARSGAIKKPAAITRCAPLRTALVMLGMYSELELDCSVIALKCNFFAIAFIP